MNLFLCIFLCWQTANTPQILHESFFLAEHSQTDRWFPYGVVIQVTQPWQGWVKIQGPNGALFERFVVLASPGEHTVFVPILIQAGEKQVAVQVGSDQHNLPLPEMRKDYQTLSLIASHQAEAPLFVHAQNLPNILAALDAVDQINIEEQAIDQLPPGGVLTLLRWAALRGRLQTTANGREKLLAKAPVDWAGQFALIQVQNNERNMLPVERLPASPVPAIKSKDFIALTDMGLWLLILYMVLSCGFLFILKHTDRVSYVAFFAALIGFAEMVPGIGWPTSGFPWRNIIATQEHDALIVEDHFFFNPKRVFIFQPNEYLFFPQLNSDLRLAWEKDALVEGLQGENRLYWAQLAGGRRLALDQNNLLRNSMATLEQVCFSLPKQPTSGYVQEFPLGEVLGGEDYPLPPPGKPPRPLIDYLRSRWVRGEWLIGRFTQDPWQAQHIRDLKPRESFLVWHVK